MFSLFINPWFDSMYNLSYLPITKKKTCVRQKGRRAWLINVKVIEVNWKDCFHDQGDPGPIGPQGNPGRDGKRVSTLRTCEVDKVCFFVIFGMVESFASPAEWLSQQVSHIVWLWKEPYTHKAWKHTAIIAHIFWHFSVMIQTRDREASFKMTTMYLVNRISHLVLMVVLIHDFEMNRFVVRSVSNCTTVETHEQEPRF